MPDIRWNIDLWSKDVQRWADEHPEHQYGYQWGDPDELPFLVVVRDQWLLPLLSPRKTVLEIGSGGGRWTRYLLPAQRLYCVDVNPEMFHYLLERLGPRANLSFVRTAGTDLPGIEPRSIDLVFTFGTFVHLEAELIDAYLRSIRTVIRPDGDVLLHYSDKEKPAAAENQGFAHTTTRVMEDLLAENGYTIVRHGTDFLPHSNIVHARPRL